MQQIIDMQENKIGETFEYEGKMFEVKAGHVCDCLKCAFDNDTAGCHSFLCTPSGRKDRKWVYFEEVNNG